MVDTAIIISIVIAIVSFLGTIIVAFVSHETATKFEEKHDKLEPGLIAFRDKRQEEKELAALTVKYAQPLMVATNELQARLYELLEYPDRKEHLETNEGLGDINIFTWYTFACLLAWTHILKSKMQYFSFAEDEKLKKIGDQILRLNEKFDRRRGDDGRNVGV
jgi:hypothetical protein